MFLELWKRYSAEITHRWDLTGFDIHEEHPRPQYLARLKNVKKREVNIITNMVEPHVPFWRMKLPATVLSFSVVLLLVCWSFEGFAVLGSVFSILVSYSIMMTSKILKKLYLGLLRSVARMGEERGVYRVLMGKPEGRRPLGRPRCRWADNIRMDFQEVGCVYRDWIGLAQDRDRWRTLVSAVMNLRVP